jgi:hypothetical protein
MRPGAPVTAAGKVGDVNRRRPVVVAIACALVALPSCATFNRNDIAAEVGGRSLTAKAIEALAAAGDQPASADQLRDQLTKWIRVNVLEASTGTPAPVTAPTAADLDARYTQALAAIGSGQAQTNYEAGVNGPLICLRAITVDSLDDANEVLTTLQSGTSFADAAHQFSTDTIIAAAGGIVTGPDNSECLDPSGVNPAVVAALQDTPVGQPIAADLETFFAVLMLRPYNELLPESQSLIASTSVSQDQLDEIVDAAHIYVDPRYGRWDPDSGSVVTLSS